MSFFDFLLAFPRYSGKPATVARLDARRAFVVEPFRAELKGARVLDLAAHDGRWCYALADADPLYVHGVEGRANLVAEFAQYPDDHRKSKITMQHGEVFETLERLIAQGRQFDVVACLGFFYHITDHYRLLSLIHALSPRLIILDSEFTFAKGPIVTFGQEVPTNDLNTLERVPGQASVLVGTPSRRWLWRAAETLGYELDWMDWDSLATQDRGAVTDYYRDGPKRRGTVALRPKPIT